MGDPQQHGPPVAAEEERGHTGGVRQVLSGALRGFRPAPVGDTVSAEGAVTYKALLFIPSQPSGQYYTEDFEPGLQLYSSGVMIMDKCADLLPECFNFVRGVVDSPDLSLNISRELLQHDPPAEGHFQQSGKEGPQRAGADAEGRPGRAMRSSTAASAAS